MFERHISKGKSLVSLCPQFMHPPSKGCGEGDGRCMKCLVHTECPVSVLLVGVILIVVRLSVNRCLTEWKKDIPGRGVKEHDLQSGKNTANCGRGQPQCPSQPLKGSGFDPQAVRGREALNRF